MSDSLQNAVREGKTDAVERLIADGVSVDGQDAEGQSALHWAAALGKVEIVMILLQAGANTTLRDNSGYSPFYRAVAAKQRAVVALLKSRDK